jgi:hypothetical protein
VTLPIAYRRSTAAETRANRAAFAALKARCQANPSPEMQALRSKKRGDDQRAKALVKLKRALRGVGILPFSALQATKIRPAEHDQLKAEVANRLAQLTPEERAAVNRNSHLLIACFRVDELRAIAAAAAVAAVWPTSNLRSRPASLMPLEPTQPVKALATPATPYYTPGKPRREAV